MLNTRKVELELFSDAEFQKRSFFVSKRYSKTSNNYLKSYDSRHIIYLDANNYYGYKISNFFPKGAFRLIDPKNFDSNNNSSNISKGCFSEVDLKYP